MPVSIFTPWDEYQGITVRSILNGYKLVMAILHFLISLNIDIID
jgi:hypothetical protein